MVGIIANDDDVGVKIGDDDDNDERFSTLKASYMFPKLRCKGK